MVFGIKFFGIFASFLYVLLIIVAEIDMFKQKNNSRVATETTTQTNVPRPSFGRTQVPADDTDHTKSTRSTSSSNNNTTNVI